MPHSLPRRRSTIPPTHPPNIPEAAAANSRPDIWVERRDARGSLQALTLVEIKTCQDTRHRRTLTRAQEQHQQLLATLKTTYPRARIDLVPILIGVTGTIYNEHTVAALKALGVTTSGLQRCLHKIHRLAVTHLASIVGVRRQLENSPTAQLPPVVTTSRGRQQRPGAPTAPRPVAIG